MVRKIPPYSYKLWAFGKGRFDILNDSPLVAVETAESGKFLGVIPEDELLALALQDAKAYIDEHLEELAPDLVKLDPDRGL